MAEPARKSLGVRKAAVLLATLGEEASKAVFPHLRDDEIQELGREIAVMERATAEEASEILEEFHHLTLARAYVIEGGVEYAKKLLRQSLPPERSRDILERLLKYLDQGSGFETLKRADPRILSKIIQKEHPQTIAFVLSHLDPGKAAHAVSSLPTDLQVEVARRMANLEEISPEVVRKVSAVLDRKIDSMAGSSIEIQGVKTVAEILNRMGRNESKEILDKLDQDNPELSANIRQLMFVFDDIQFLPEKAIQEILKRADKSVLTLALKGASQELQEKIFRNMSSRAVETLKEELSFMGPVRVSEVAEAQSTITEIVRQLEEEGLVVLGGGEADEYI
ncbi:MAG: flagellar motor switch protein FliG [Deferrisomatales bacterium]